MNRVVPNGTLRGVEGEGQISPIRLTIGVRIACRLLLNQAVGEKAVQEETEAEQWNI